MTFLYILIFLIALIIIVNLASKGDRQKKKLELEKKNAEFKKSVNVEKLFYSGKYITGHPQINQPTIKTAIGSSPENLIIVVNPSTPEAKEIGKIPIKDIEDAYVEDASTIEKRVTATRLLTTGIFAFALKKKEKHELYYVTIKWKDGKFLSETIFEITGLDCLGAANRLRNFIRDTVNIFENEKEVVKIN